MQANEFARNFNSPLTDLNDHVIIQVRPFNSPMIGVPMSRLMSSVGESPSTLISTILAEGVPPPLVGTPRKNIPATPLTPSSRVVQPSTSTNVVGTSCGVVTRIPSVPFASPSFLHTTQSGPIGSFSFVQGFLWNGGHIPPSTHYVGPTPTYVGMHFGNTNTYGQGFQTLVSAPFMSSHFSLFSGGILALVFQTPISSRGAQTTYTALHINNPLAYGWNPFQSSQLLHN